LKIIYPQKHNIFYIPSGKLHALGKGLLIYEIQQPADITYRLYDYERGRHMDISQAINNVDIPSNHIKINKTGILKTPYFNMEYINNSSSKYYAFKAK
jgi:mannose-6-phosphate isomerase